MKFCLVCHDYVYVLSSECRCKQSCFGFDTHITHMFGLFSFLFLFFPLFRGQIPFYPLIETILITEVFVDLVFIFVSWKID